MEQNMITLTKKPTRIQRINTAVKQGALVAGATAMTSYAMAEGSLDALGTSFTGEISAAKAIVITILTVSVTVLAVFVGWKYIKKGGNAA